MKALRMTAEEYEAAMKRAGRIVGVRQVIGMPDPESPPEKPQKYRNKPCVVDGERCDSKKEAARYMLLRELQRRGDIQNLVLHARVTLAVNGRDICDFEPDLLYERGGKLCAEDVKGMKRGTTYQMFKIKARLFWAIHGTEVVEV